MSVADVAHQANCILDFENLCCPAIKFAIGAADVGMDMVGSYLPFARTRAEREKAADPRRSVEERYSGREEYVKQVTAAAKALVEQRFLLERDVPGLAARAAARWDGR